MESNLFVTRLEHDEFCKRLDEENRRQDKRIELLENNLDELRTLTTSVRELAVNMKNMASEQEKQGKRLEVLEGRDGEMWRKVIGYAVTAVVGILIGFICSQFGIR